MTSSSLLMVFVAILSACVCIYYFPTLCDHHEYNYSSLESHYYTNRIDIYEKYFCYGVYSILHIFDALILGTIKFWIVYTFIVAGYCSVWNQIFLCHLKGKFILLQSSWELLQTKYIHVFKCYGTDRQGGFVIVSFRCFALTRTQCGYYICYSYTCSGWKFVYM